AAWSESAFTRTGCAWPRPFTAMPASASRYFFPSVSQSHAPSPRANDTGWGEYVCIRCEAVMRVAPRNENGGPQAAVARGNLRLRAGGAERLDLRGQAALVSRGLVLVDDALVGDVVDGRLLGAERRLGGPHIARGDRLLDLLDGAAQLGAQALVGGALLDARLGALGCLFGVGHGLLA